MFVKVISVVLTTGKREEAAHQETTKCIHDLHENQESGGYKGVYVERVCSHQSDTRQNGEYYCYFYSSLIRFPFVMVITTCIFDSIQWHALDRSEQAKYYEMAREERARHMQVVTAD